MPKDRSLVKALVQDPAITDEELRSLATVRGSAFHKALSVAFTLLRNASRDKVLDPTIDFPTTQFHRGRLEMLSDIVLLLEEEAPRRYDDARKAAEKKSPESKP